VTRPTRCWGWHYVTTHATGLFSLLLRLPRSPARPLARSLDPSPRGFAQIWITLTETAEENLRKSWLHQFNSSPCFFYRFLLLFGSCDGGGGRQQQSQNRSWLQKQIDIPTKQRPTHAANTQQNNNNQHQQQKRRRRTTTTTTATTRRSSTSRRRICENLGGNWWLVVMGELGLDFRF